MHLYGVSPAQAYQLNKAGCKYAIDIFNYSATAKAENSPIITTPIVAETLAAFIKTADNDVDNPQPDAVNDPLSQIGRAHSAFWKAIEDVSRLFT